MEVREGDVDLVLLALPVQPDPALRPSHSESLAPVGDGCGKNRLLGRERDDSLVLLSFSVKLTCIRSYCSLVNLGEKM